MTNALLSAGFWAACAGAVIGVAQIVVSFMGGERETTLAIGGLQTLLLLPALLLSVAVVLRFRAKLPELWARVPAWAAVFSGLLIFIVGIAELALLLTQRLTGGSVHWVQHLAALSAIPFVIAGCLCLAGRTPPLPGRTQ